MKLINDSFGELTYKNHLHWGWLCQSKLLSPGKQTQIHQVQLKDEYLMGINPPQKSTMTNLALFTQSSHVPLGFLALNGSRRFSRISQAFFKAAPLRSEDAEAAVALVLGTVLVLVSDMWIFEEGIPRTLLATWKHTAKTVLNASEWLNSFSLNCSSVKTVNIQCDVWNKYVDFK